MTTATATKGKRRRRAAKGPGPGMLGKGPGPVPGGHAAAEPTGGTTRDRAAPRMVEHLDADPDLFELHPLHAPREADDELVESVRRNGLLQPVVARRVGNGLELLAGQRRLDACRRAGETVRTEAFAEGACSDAEAAAIVFAENADRKDLDRIEEASYFQSALAAGAFAGVAELAAAVGRSEAYVRNALNLLNLPAKLRKRLVSGEMPVEVARKAAAAGKAVPAVFDELEKDYQQKARKPWMEEIDAERVEDLVDDVTRPMAGKIFDPRPAKYRDAMVPSFTDEELAELDVVEVPRGKKTERVARNVKRWEELIAAKLDAAQATKAQRQKAAAAKTAKKLADPKISAAERKRLEAEAGKRARKLREQLDRRRDVIVDQWRRELVGTAIRKDQVEHRDLVAMVVIAAHYGNTRWDDTFRAQVHGAERIAHATSLVPRLGSRGDDEWLDLMAAAERQDDVMDAVAAWLAELIWPKTGDDRPADFLPAAVVTRLCEMLSVDLGTAWAVGGMGDLTEAWFGTYTKAELEAIVRREKLIVDDKKKQTMVAALAEVAKAPKRPLAMPEELRKAVAAKKQRRKKGTGR